MIIQIIRFVRSTFTWYLYELKERVLPGTWWCDNGIDDGIGGQKTWYQRGRVFYLNKKGGTIWDDVKKACIWLDMQTDAQLDQQQQDHPKQILTNTGQISIFSFFHFIKSSYFLEHTS